MSDGLPDEDPGWGRGRDIFLAALLPQYAARLRVGSALVHLRTVFIGFSAMLVGVGLVTMILTAGSDGGSGSLDVTTACLATGTIAVLSQALGRVMEKDLDCSTDEALVSSYRARFFLRVAFANTASLVGFVAAFVTASPLPYLIGAVVTAVRFVSIAPTMAHLQSEQEALRPRGCGRDLVQTLRANAPTAEIRSR